MWGTEIQIQISNHLKKYEELLSDLYRIFAMKFPDYASFWNDLSVEENTHAFMIDSLSSMIKEGSQFFDNRDYDLPYLLKNIDRLKDYISNLKEKDLTLISAIRFAVSVESEPIEKDVFKMMTGDSEEVKRVLNILHEDTKRHYFKIKEMEREISRVS